MLFPTYEFLLFFFIVLICVSLLKSRITSYKFFLLFINIIFYSFWGINFLELLIANIVINYLILEGISFSSKNKKILLTFGIIINIVYLGFFKYYNFFIDSFQETLNLLQIHSNIQILEVIIPIGISFYTFRIISHLIDCYRNQISCPRFLDYFIYITYFPQIASGPISRAKEFYQQLNSQDKYKYKIERVIILIISGLFKKYTLSSFLFNFTKLPFQLPEQYSSFDLILAALAYSCYIYVDFSGYSDLANAISNLLGFPSVNNFNMPYRARSLQEFWHRWHISLSEWLRDYLYIPLGGSRKGKVRKNFNLLLTMVIGGFWHGAGFNFIIWGFLHGFGLIVNHIWKGIVNKSQTVNQFKETNIENQLIIFSDDKESKIFLKWCIFYMQKYLSLCKPIFFSILTFSYITFCWIFFNTPNLEISWKFLRQIINISSNSIFLSQFNIWQLYTVFCIVLVMNFYGDKISFFMQNIIARCNLLFQILFVSTSLYIVFRLGPSTVPPFVYFGF